MSSTTFTIDDLKQYLRAAIGDDESVDLSGDITNTPFADLGFDSLAIIDTTSRVEQTYGVSLPEDDAALAETPGELLALVTGALDKVAA